MPPRSTADKRSIKNLPQSRSPPASAGHEVPSSSSSTSSPIASRTRSSRSRTTEQPSVREVTALSHSPSTPSQRTQRPMHSQLVDNPEYDEVDQELLDDDLPVADTPPSAPPTPPRGHTHDQSDPVGSTTSRTEATPPAHQPTRGVPGVELQSTGEKVSSSATSAGPSRDKVRASRRDPASADASLYLPLRTARSPSATSAGPSRDQAATNSPPRLLARHEAEVDTLLHAIDEASKHAATEDEMREGRSAFNRLAAKGVRCDVRADSSPAAAAILPTSVIELIPEDDTALLEAVQVVKNSCCVQAVSIRRDRRGRRYASVELRDHSAAIRLWNRGEISAFGIGILASVRQPPTETLRLGPPTSMKLRITGVAPELSENDSSFVTTLSLFGLATRPDKDQDSGHYFLLAKSVNDAKILYDIVHGQWIGWSHIQVADA